MSVGGLFGKAFEVLLLPLLGLSQLQRVLLALLPGLAALYYMGQDVFETN